MPDTTHDLIVVGAGASGLMAAIQAAGRGLDVLVLERQGLIGARLCLSGMGVGAVSNAGLDVSRFHGRHNRFVADALAAFDAEALCAWFAERGAPLTEAPEYGLIVSGEGGAALVEALLNALESSGAQLATEAPVTEVRRTAGGFEVNAVGETFTAASVVLATGDGHMPQLGACDSGPALAAALGHGIAPFLPSQAPLKVAETWAMRVCGIWMESRLALEADGKTVTESFGSVLFTHSGLTGEAIFNIAGEVESRLTAGQELTLRVNFYPDLDREAVAEWMHRTLGERTRERAAAALDYMLPLPLAEAMLAALKVKPHARSMHLEKSTRDTLLEMMTAARLSVTGTLGPRAAESMSGGVNVREIDPRTFASRVTPGLYVTGGLLDVSGDWGGFEQHFALASGYVAGRNAAT